ncbi:TolC family protein [Burkholderia cepacia]|uniref:TolC family protein n=1 Tax=Burkholderia cepacia TaxID=292 RepID=UPI00075D1F52|nr:TolC family protein [Burkholderia cepacia]KVS56772.1 channel protein TolC [Burkholderia cepacia]RQT80691.1 TolC family protein [Burkholderia cepacia]RQT99634.1 TolC family protein [Burkholderia cepacia]RQZ77359.1 TolC family protein [Burkholderia cepacia]RRA03351.1 TolC family protein [Burkholderia cepacia]
MKLCLIVAVSIAVLAMPACANAQAIDVFRTLDHVSATPTTPILRDASCRAMPEDRPLELDDAILQAICASPQARRAWAEARVQAAALGVADSAYLPTVNATVGVEHDTLSTTYDYSAFGASEIRRSQSASSRYGMLTLNWVLFDFGKRDAARRRAGALLVVANAAQDEVLQSVILNAAQAFYALRNARASLDAAQRTESIAQESFGQASAKHAAGAGTLADELQARTSYRRAMLDRVSADGEARVASGALAVTMGLDANVPVRIDSPELTVEGQAELDAGVDQLIDEAKRRQPKLAAARARLDAARANVDAARAQGRPTIALTGSVTQNSPSYQQQSVPVTGSRGSTIGVQLTIPLFEGFASGYRTGQAQAQAEAQEAALHDAELQVSLDVWTSYQSLRADAANLSNSRELLADALRALDVARGRYKEGVGTFTELLNAQTALADAQKQRVLAVSKWRNARLKLFASLGRLDVSVSQK